MDEAFSALDPLIRAEMQRELLELQAELHRTIVFITHDLDEALTLGDRIAIMREGRMVQVGTPEEILRAPANAYVRSFVQNVDRTQVLSVEALMTDVLTVSLRERITATEADRPPDAVQAAARRALRDGSLPADPSVLYVVDAAGRPLGRWTRGADPAVRTDVPTVAADASIAQALSTVLDAGGPVGVVDADGRLVGTIDREAVLQEVRRNANG
jgi:glycine betaine/proline transport system ATP-binding protein